MDQPLYDIYFTGSLVESTDPQAAQASFARMFKASPEAVSRFFNGKPQIVKRGVDKAEALKFKAALHKAGMMVAFKAHQVESTAPQPTTGKPVAPSSNQSAIDQPATDNVDTQQEDWSLAPAGSEVLRAEERKEIPAQDIDTSSIKMVSAFANLEPEPRETPPAPNTSHLSVAPAGEDLLVDKPEDPPPLPLDLDAITLAPAGAELEELRDDLPPVNPDISRITLAAAGSDILEGQHKDALPPAPNTDHLSVANPNP